MKLSNGIGVAFRSARLLQGDSFLQFSVFLAFLVLLNKLLGFAEKVVIARSFGSSADSDAFLIAQNILLTGWFVIEDVFAPALIPVLQSMVGGPGGVEGKKSLIRLVMFFSIFPCAAFLIIPYIFPLYCADIFYPGLSHEAREKVTDLWKYFILGSLPFLLTPILQAYSHSNRNFYSPALSQFVGRLGMLACFILLSGKYGIAAGGLGIIAYGTIHIVTLAFLLRFPVRFPVSGWKKHSPELKRISYLALPLILGLFFSQASHWIDMRLISSLPAGSLSALAYAKKLIDAPVVVGAFCLGAVLLPYLSSYYENGDYAAFRRLLSGCFWLCAIGYILLALCYWLFGETIVRVVFEGGRFSEASTESVARLVKLFALGLPVFALEILIMQASFALRNHWQAILAGAGCACLHTAIVLWLFPRFGIAIIPITIVGQKAAKSAILGLLLLRKLRMKELAKPLAPTIWTFE